MTVPPDRMLAAVAAVVSYEHPSELVRTHGESGLTGRLIPLTVDDLIYASSMVMLDSARRSALVPGLARWLLGWHSGDAGGQRGARPRSWPDWNRIITWVQLVSGEGQVMPAGSGPI